VTENLIELHPPSGPPTDHGQLVGAGNHDRGGGVGNALTAEIRQRSNCTQRSSVMKRH
jgi:hypothetical protein